MALSAQSMHTGSALQCCAQLTVPPGFLQVPDQEPMRGLCLHACSSQQQLHPCVYSNAAGPQRSTQESAHSSCSLQTCTCGCAGVSLQLCWRERAMAVGTLEQWTGAEAGPAMQQPEAAAIPQGTPRQQLDIWMSCFWLGSFGSAQWLCAMP